MIYLLFTKADLETVHTHLLLTNACAKQTEIALHRRCISSYPKRTRAFRIVCVEVDVPAHNKMHSIIWAQGAIHIIDVHSDDFRPEHVQPATICAMQLDLFQF